MGDQLMKMERKVLAVVGFDLGYPISYRILRRYGRVCKVTMPVLTLARYILEMSLMEYNFNVELSESKLAASCLVLAFTRCSRSRQRTTSRRSGASTVTRFSTRWPPRPSPTPSSSRKKDKVEISLNQKPPKVENVKKPSKVKKKCVKLCHDSAGFGLNVQNMFCIKVEKRKCIYCKIFMLLAF